MSDPGRPAVDRRTRGSVAAGFPLVAIAAALWGTDALFRRGLALELPAPTVVFWEHVILVAVTLPILLRIPWRRLDARGWGAIVVVGAGASAAATVMFTAAFRYGDPSTPLLLQKIQPLVALVFARVILGERWRPVFGVYLVTALGAAWLITFPDPFAVSRPQAAAGALAVGAAILWGLGTVLGRYLTSSLRPVQIAAARFGAGLPAAAVLVWVLGDGWSGLDVTGQDTVALVALAFVPGLLSLLIYYRGLERTSASAATLAELAFPVSAIAVNYLAFGTTVNGSQVLGLTVLAAVLVALSVAGQRRPRRVGVEVAPLRPAAEPT